MCGPLYIHAARPAQSYGRLEGQTVECTCASRLERPEELVENTLLGPPAAFRGIPSPAVVAVRRPCQLRSTAFLHQIWVNVAHHTLRVAGNIAIVGHTLVDERVRTDHHIAAYLDRPPAGYVNRTVLGGVMAALSPITMPSNFRCSPQTLLVALGSPISFLTLCLKFTVTSFP